MKKQKQQTGQVNYIWVLAGGYLIYLAFKIGREIYGGNASNPVIGAAGAVAFAGVGAALLIREWRAYQYGLKHIDDPTSWSDEDEELPEHTEEDA